MPDPTPSRNYWHTGRKDMRTLAPNAFDSAKYIYAHFLYPPDDRPEMPQGWTRFAFYGVADDASDPQISAEYVADLLNARDQRIAELEADCRCASRTAARLEAKLAAVREVHQSVINDARNNERIDPVVMDGLLREALREAWDDTNRNI